MPVYSKAKYAEEVKQKQKEWSQFGFANILQIQTLARKISNGPTPAYVRKAHYPAPAEDDVLQSLLLAVDGLRQSSEQYARPTLADVSAEWVAEDHTSKDGPVIFYVHGGGFIYGSPGTARRATRQLARRSKGRCFAVQYRYATDQPFPAPLLDLLVAYLSLLAPPDSVKDTAVPADKIVFAGESAGLNACFSLTQILLYLRKHKPVVQFHGEKVEIKLPAGITGVSGMFDITCSLPSFFQNTKWDCLQEVEPSYTHRWKDQELWPANPPRADMYCERSAMLHPLVSSVTVPDWENFPPLFIACGEERVADSNLYIAQTAARQGVPVYLQQYEHMLHVWPTVLPKLPHSDHVLEVWATQCQNLAQGKIFETRMESVAFDDFSVSTCDVKNCCSLDRASLLECMKKGQQQRLLIRRKDQTSKL